MKPTRSRCYTIDSAWIAKHVKVVPRALAPNVNMTSKRLLTVVDGLAAAQREEAEALARLDGGAA